MISRANKAILFASILVFVFLSLGCDPLQSFTFTNATGQRIELTYKVFEEGHTGSLSEDAYVLEAGETVSTHKDAGISGDVGATIFFDGALLRVRAEADGQTIFDKTYTYDEIEALDYTVVIRETPDSATS